MEYFDWFRLKYIKYTRLTFHKIQKHKLLFIYMASMVSLWEGRWEDKEVEEEQITPH